MIMRFSIKHNSKPYYKHTPITYYITFLLLSPSVINAQYLTDNIHSYFRPNGGPLFLGIALAITTIIALVIFIILNFFCKPIVRPRVQADNGSACTGLDPSVLETFPVFKYPEMVSHRSMTGQMECSVCLSPFEVDEILRLLPKCNHVFHVSCLDPWLKDHTSCPLCRVDLVPGLSELTQVDSGRVGESGSEVGNHRVFEVRKEGDIEAGQVEFNGRHGGT